VCSPFSPPHSPPAPPFLPPSPPPLQSCIKKIDPEDIEIDIDAIDSSTFWMVDAFIKDCLPGGKKYSKKKALPGGGGGAAEQSKAKKSRVA
jgi:hypothetical protein